MLAMYIIWANTYTRRNIQKKNECIKQTHHRTVENMTKCVINS